MESFYSNVLSKFFNVSVIKAAKADGKLFDLDVHNVENQLSDENLFIGLTTKQNIQKLLREGDISEYRVKKFYKGARSFLTIAAEYIIKVYPIKDDSLKYAKFVNFERREEMTFCCRVFSEKVSSFRSSTATK